MKGLIIETERLLIRDFIYDDWKTVYTYMSDPEVVKYMKHGPNDEEQTKGFVNMALSFQEQENRLNFELAVIEKMSGIHVGGGALYISSPEDRVGWIGYCFHQNFWGKGYATETASELIDFGFRQLGLHRIYAKCDVLNGDSARILEKVGMMREGCLRQEIWQKGRWRDSYLYAVLEHEWTRKEYLNSVSSVEVDQFI